MAATPSTSSKHRKVDSECRGFNPVWREKYLFAERYGKAQCLICLSTVAVFKEFNIKRHWESNHANTSKYAAMDRAARLACASHLEESLDKQAASFSKKSALQTTNESVTRAGYEISRIIACHIKPFTDGEYIKECVLSAVDAVCPAERKKMAGLCLPAHTVTRRTEHMAGNVRETLSQTCASLEFLSIALDESTDQEHFAACCLHPRSDCVLHRHGRFPPVGAASRQNYRQDRVRRDPQLPRFYWPRSCPPGVRHH